MNGQKQSAAEEQALERIRANYGRDGQIYGCGTSLLGRFYASEEDREAGIHTRTRWLTFLMLPVFPLGTYRILQFKDKVNARGRIIVPFVVVSQEPLAWRQIIRTWLVSFALAAACIALFVWWTGPL